MRNTIIPDGFILKISTQQFAINSRMVLNNPTYPKIKTKAIALY